MEQTQQGQDGKRGSWTRGVTETALLARFYGMKLLQASTLTGFLNALTPGALWFHSYQFFIFGVKNQNALVFDQMSKHLIALK